MEISTIVILSYLVLDNSALHFLLFSRNGELKTVFIKTILSVVATLTLWVLYGDLTFSVPKLVLFCIMLFSILSAHKNPTLKLPIPLMLLGIVDLALTTMCLWILGVI